MYHEFAFLLLMQSQCIRPEALLLAATEARRLVRIMQGAQQIPGHLHDALETRSKQLILSSHHFASVSLFEV